MCVVEGIRVNAKASKSIF